MCRPIRTNSQPAQKEPAKLDISIEADRDLNTDTKGRGAPIGGSAERRGDLLARIKIVVPKKLSRAQRDALEKFAMLDGENPRASLLTQAETA